MAPENSALSKTKAFLMTASSLAASSVVLRTVVDDLLPCEIRDRIYSGVRKLFGGFFSSDFTVVMEEYEGFAANEIYDAARTYLAGRTSPSTRKMRASKQADGKGIVAAIEPGEEVVDVFEGVQFRWRLVGRQRKNHYGGSSESWFFELSFRRKHKALAMGSYLPHVMSKSRAMKADDKAIKLHMLMYDNWNPVNFDHPATFDTLAMEPDLKQMVMEDLQKFVNSKDYYRRVGRPWKRGYLLYGPPGTGKSSLVAAMANFLRFDVYDLELTKVCSNTALRALLVATANRSILVVEDIDCSVDVCTRSREEAAETQNGDDNVITLSGLLNFADGLWSSIGEERIIVFTTNHKERLDPALLRPGRMDVHINMGYCSTTAFRTLASSYHGVDEHPLFGEIEGLMQRVDVTPAVVAGELMKSGHAEAALQGLINFLHEKKKVEADEGPVAKREESAVATGQMGTGGEPNGSEIEVDEYSKSNTRCQRCTKSTPSVYDA